MIYVFYQRQPPRGSLFSTLNPVHSKNCVPSTSRAWCVGAFCWQSPLLRQGFVVSLPAVPLMGSCPTLYTYQKRFVLLWALPELPFFSHENMQDQTPCWVHKLSMETAATPGVSISTFLSSRVIRKLSVWPELKSCLDFEMF